MRFYNKESSDYSYFKVFLAIFSAIVSSIIVYFLFSNFGYIINAFDKLISILMPVILGIVFACLFDPIVRRIEVLFNKKFKIKSNIKVGRIVGIVITYLIIIILFMIFIRFLIPSLLDSINIMFKNFPKYLENIFNIIRRMCDKYNISTQFLDNYSSGINDLIKKSVVPNLDIIINNLASGITSVLKVLINIIVSIIISVYLIYDKEIFINGMDKVVKAFCSTKVYNEVVNISKNVYRLFGGFMIAKLIDSLIIGVITYVCMTILNIPYALLISVIVCITNIIPFFGPFIGAIPSMGLLVMISPAKALEFGILILIIQQFDGNILGPKLIGNKIGIKSFWVLFAILLFGGLFGFVGMIFAVPLFVLIYDFIKNKVDKKLQIKKENELKTKKIA